MQRWMERLDVSRIFYVLDVSCIKGSPAGRPDSQATAAAAGAAIGIYYIVIQQRDSLLRPRPRLPLRVHGHEELHDEITKPGGSEVLTLHLRCLFFLSLFRGRR